MTRSRRSRKRNVVSKGLFQINCGIWGLGIVTVFTNNVSNDFNLTDVGNIVLAIFLAVIGYIIYVIMEKYKYNIWKQIIIYFGSIFTLSLLLKWGIKGIIVSLKEKISLLLPTHD